MNICRCIRMSITIHGWSEGGEAWYLTEGVIWLIRGWRGMISYWVCDMADQKVERVWYLTEGVIWLTKGWRGMISYWGCDMADQRVERATISRGVMERRDRRAVINCSWNTVEYSSYVNISGWSKQPLRERIGKSSFDFKLKYKKYQFKKIAK